MNIFQVVVSELIDTMYGDTSQEVREYLVSKGYKNNTVRTAIALLWDSGKLNVGLDQLLHPNF